MPRKTVQGRPITKSMTNLVRRRKKIKSVIRMLSVMEASRGANQQESGAATKGLQTPDETYLAASKEFLETGRTGRRNALHDILDAGSQTSTADLPDQLEKLSTRDTTNEPTASTSRSGEKS